MVKRPQIKRYIACIQSETDPNYLEVRIFDDAGLEAERWFRDDCKEFGFIHDDQTPEFINEFIDTVGEEIDDMDMDDDGYRTMLAFEKVKNSITVDKGFKRLFMFVYHKYDVSDVIAYIEHYGVVEGHSNI